MIYDDQPQMVGAARRAGCDPTKHLPAAFAAIDREALIEKVRREAHFIRGTIPPSDVIEEVLVAAGIIPERETGHPPESTMQEYRA